MKPLQAPTSHMLTTLPIELIPVINVNLDTPSILSLGSTCHHLRRHTHVVLRAIVVHPPEALYTYNYEAETGTLQISQHRLPSLQRYAMGHPTALVTVAIVVLRTGSGGAVSSVVMGCPLPMLEELVLVQST